MQSVLLAFSLFLGFLSPVGGQNPDGEPVPAPRLEAPLDWRVEESDDVTLVLTQERHSARLVVAELEQVESVEGDTLERRARQLARSISTYLGTDEPAVEPVMFQNEPAFEFRTDDGERVRLQRLFERRGRAFSITIEAPTENFQSVRQVAEQMLKTLRLFE
jgi:hypothetical protein